MNGPESVALARYIRAHFPQQPIDEFTSEALLELLAPYPAVDARAAVLAIASRGEHWCPPTAVRDEVRRIRSKRIDQHPPLVPPPGLDDEQEARWLGAARRRIGDGEVIDCDAAWELTAAPPRLRELIARATPDLTRQEHDMDTTEDGAA